MTLFRIQSICWQSSWTENVLTNKCKFHSFFELFWWTVEQFEKKSLRWKYEQSKYWFLIEFLSHFCRKIMHTYLIWKQKKKTSWKCVTHPNVRIHWVPIRVHFVIHSIRVLNNLSAISSDRIESRVLIWKFRWHDASNENSNALRLILYSFGANQVQIHKRSRNYRVIETLNFDLASIKMLSCNLFIKTGQINALVCGRRKKIR